MRESIKQIMTSNIFFIEASSSLSEVVDMFRSYPLNHLPVLSDDTLVGMVSRRDIIPLSLGNSFGSEEDMENAGVFDIVKVEDIMNKQEAVVKQSDQIFEVADLFTDDRIHALPVVDDNGLVGIITASDIVKHQLSKASNNQVPEKYTEQRPWGGFEQFCQNTPCTVKILHVNPNEELSLQYHEHRNEFWKVIEGEGTIIIGNDEQAVEKGNEFIIPARTNHQIKTSFSPMKVLEVSFGHFDEGDIVRISDKYNRTREKTEA